MQPITKYCLLKKQVHTNIEITYLMLLIIIENFWQVFKFHLALYEWGQIALSSDFSSWRPMLKSNTGLESGGLMLSLHELQKKCIALWFFYL